MVLNAAVDAAALGGHTASADGLERARTHPKFLHSNATSHKWAIGAIAELIDNAYDQMSVPAIQAVQIKIDVVPLGDAQGGQGLCVRDNGGGMDRGAMHRMMSFGVSKEASNRIGRYGNGFKSSAIRLGSDALVLSVDVNTGRFCAGLLSYTFLVHDRLEDVVVPIIEWDERGRMPGGLSDSAAEHRASALRTLLAWGPGYSEERVLAEIRKLRPHGTAVLVYNLWENENGDKELDLFSNLSDVLTRPAGSDEPNGAGGGAKGKGGEQRAAAKAKFFAYQHSLREYAAILYRQHPPGFTMVLRGRRIEPRIITKDLKHVRIEKYTPAVQPASGQRWRSVGPVRPGSGAEIFNPALSDALAEKAEKAEKAVFTRAQFAAFGVTAGGQHDLRMSSFVKVGDLYFVPSEIGKTYKVHIGFAKEAPNVDAQGFNLYHNNRLIKPMWEVYKSPSSVGRGVIGVVEVDFVQPSHDKQDFERTDAMNRLEAKLKQLVPSYWKTNGRRVGYMAADPLPQELRERAAEEAARRAAAMASDSESDDDETGRRGAPTPANLQHSRLFGDREGSRKRKLPMHMGDYRIYHSSARPGLGPGSAASQGRPQRGAGGGDAALAGPRDAVNGGEGAGSSSSSHHPSLHPSLHPDVVTVEAVLVDTHGAGSGGGVEGDLVAAASVVNLLPDSEVRPIHPAAGDEEEVVWVDAVEECAAGSGVVDHVVDDVEDEVMDAYGGDEEAAEAEAEAAAEKAAREEEERQHRKLEAMRAEHAGLDEQIAKLQAQKRDLEARMLAEQLAIEDHYHEGSNDEDEEADVEDCE